VETVITMGLDAKQYFNDNRRDHYWDKNKEKYKRFFYRKLIDLKNAIDLDTPENELKLDSYRGLGYMGIGTQSGLSLGIKTEDAIKTKNSLGDHVIGTVEIGKYIRKECEKNNWDYNYMCEEWLYENLWIWSTITVSKAEHKNENIQIDSNSIDEKRHLKHYLNVSNFYEKDSSKRYTKKLIFD
jgi:hypothetical protein